ncbi:MULTISPECIES: phage tail length tape measure family protein [Sinorhizobium]|uniref:phage tail length tape measure family protein n=1 Tax=Sinorhizobium TaxID=28105 RepID=UPI000BE85374|nr:MULTISPECIES: phage tail length tape measure family protein [Sinorhizobium]PDT55031.1 phage tail tape measure protein [Sinorhizobium sp. NG07B]POH32074.1 phage tail tape measure protein [Sinorhizobium americanum]
MTEATLGFKIDSSPASSAAADLDKLTASAVRTEQAVGKLETEAAGLGAALGKAADGARKAGAPVESLGRSFGSQDEHIRAFRLEVERLTMKYRPLAQATQQYQATVTEIQRAHKLGAITAQEMTAALDRERQAYERLKTSATAAGAAMKAANSNRGGAQSFNSANAAFQFQDIAVTAAMGMNPLMIGLQQGTQLAAVVGSMERPVAGLAAAFTSLINPVSLVTIGLTAGVAALVQYFTTAESGTGKTNALFEEQNDLIRRAAALWGDAAPQLKAYVDELDRADKITQGREASEILAGRELEGLGEQLQGIGQQFSEAVRGLRGIDADPAFIRDFSQAFGDLRERLDDGTASIADINNAQRLLSEAVDRYGIKSVLGFRDAFDLITKSIRDSIEAAKQARAEWIAAIAGGTNVQDIISGSFFTDNGRTMRTADFVPLNPAVPSRRPNIELSGDPDATTILNPDGLLTNVPVPGQKPNFFELEEQKEKVDDVTKAYRQAAEAKADFWLDVSFQERQAERSAIDRQVASTLSRYGMNEDLNSPEANAIRSQLQREQNRELVSSFLTDFRDGLLENSGDIGKAMGDAIKNALLNALAKASDQAIERLTNSLVNMFFSGGTSSTVSGGGAATTTLSALLGYGGKAANDNRSVGGINAYAKAIQSIESGGNYGALGPVTRSGDRAYGAYQVMGANIGPWSEAALGRRLSAPEFLNDRSAQDAIFNHRFGGYVDKYGASGAAQAWFGGPGSVGKGGMGADILGTTGNAYVAKFNSALEKASGSLGQFGGGLSQFGQVLASSASGGGSGLLSSLSSFGMSVFSRSGQFASAMLSGGIGLFANGTNYAPGGLSIVGERGPELVNLPQGSQVTSNHKLMSMAANSNRGSNSAGTMNVNVIGANGDEHVRMLVQQGVGEALREYNEQQRRGGFGQIQTRYTSQKG